MKRNTGYTTNEARLNGFRRMNLTATPNMVWLKVHDPLEADHATPEQVEAAKHYDIDGFHYGHGRHEDDQPEQAEVDPAEVDARIVYEALRFDTRKPLADKSTRGPRATNRDLAKLFVKAMPIDFMPGEMLEQVTQVALAIKRLPVHQRTALQCAVIFASKVPRQEREDMLSDLTLAILESGAQDMPLQYTIARLDWQDWWAKFKTRQHYTVGFSLDDKVAQELEIATPHMVELASVSQDYADMVNETRASMQAEHDRQLRTEELLGVVDFETRLVDKLEARRVWNTLPKRIQQIAMARLAGTTTNARDRKCLSRFVNESYTMSQTV